MPAVQIKHYLAVNVTLAVCDLSKTGKKYPTLYSVLPLSHSFNPPCCPHWLVSLLSSPSLVLSGKRSFRYFLFPCSLDLISPLLLLFLASRLPNLFSHMSIDSVCFVSVCPTTRSPLAPLLSLFPFWSLLVSFLSEGLLSCPSAAR